MDERVRTGIHIVRTVAAIFPYLCFGKKSHSWSNIECRPDVLLNVRTDASWSSLKLLNTEEGPDGKFSSSRRMMLWTVGRLDGISRHSDDCKGSDLSDL
jgi:hypothetical protein